MQIHEDTDPAPGQILWILLPVKFSKSQKVDFMKKKILEVGNRPKNIPVPTKVKKPF